MSDRFTPRPPLAAALAFSLVVLSDGAAQATRSPFEVSLSQQDIFLYQEENNCQDICVRSIDNTHMVIRFRGIDLTIGSDHTQGFDGFPEPQNPLYRTDNEISTGDTGNPFPNHPGEGGGENCVAGDAGEFCFGNQGIGIHNPNVENDRGTIGQNFLGPVEDRSQDILFLEFTSPVIVDALVLWEDVNGGHWGRLTAIDDGGNPIRYTLPDGETVEDGFRFSWFGDSHPTTGQLGCNAYSDLMCAPLTALEQERGRLVTIDIPDSYEVSASRFMITGFNAQGFRLNTLVLSLTEEEQALFAPIPLPGALPLFLTGLAGLGLAGRMRRRAA